MDDTFDIKDSRINKEDLIRRLQENLTERKLHGAYIKNDESITNIISSSSPQQHDMNKIQAQIARLSMNAELITGEYKIASHRLLAGPVLIRGRTLINGEVKRYVDPIFTRQRAFNSDIVRCQESMAGFFLALDDKVFAIRQELNKATKSDVNASLAQMNSQLQDMRGSIEKVDQELKLSLSDKNTAIDRMRSEIAVDQNEAIVTIRSDVNASLAQMNSQLQDMRGSIDKLRASELCIAANQRMLTAVLDAIHSLTRSIENGECSSESGCHLSANIKLPMTSNDVIRNNYLQFSKEIGASWVRISGQTPASPNLIGDAMEIFRGGNTIIDIGCGSGFFLEALKKNYIDGYGIDTNKMLIEYCKENGLDARCSDAIQHLIALDDETLDGIFICQVLEHLSINEIDQLLHLCYRKLKPGRALIASTPNIKNIIVSSNLYYMDPTHKTQLHPEVLKFILRQCSFTNIEERYYQQVPEELRLKAIDLIEAERNPGIIKLLDNYNHNIELLNNLLFSERDYAVICRK